MNFDKFQSVAKILKEIPLGGQDAQFKLAPDLRLDYDEKMIAAQKPKLAAVLALFYPDKNNQTRILLTERASYRGTHSAQISFPGGKKDKTETSLIETALRETYEEVGLSREKIQVIRELTDVYIPPSNFLAKPFIGLSNKTPEFKINHEVASLIEIHLKDLLNDNNIKNTVVNTSYMSNYKVPTFQFNNHTVWGATGMMLSEIKEMINRITL